MTVTYPASTVAIKHKSRQHKLDNFIPPAAMGLSFVQKSSRNTPAFCVDYVGALPVLAQATPPYSFQTEI